jgi:hypothetical protein
MEKQNKQQNQQNAIEQRLFLKTRNGNVRSTGKQSTPKAEEGYCYEATQSGPPTHNQSHQAQHTAKHEEVKHRQAWKKRGGTRSDMVLHVLQTALYRKLQENV